MAVNGNWCSIKSRKSLYKHMFLSFNMEMMKQNYLRYRYMSVYTLRCTVVLVFIAGTTLEVHTSRVFVGGSGGSRVQISLVALTLQTSPKHAISEWLEHLEKKC